MSKIEVKFVKNNDNATPFKYTRNNDACMDIYASEDVVLHKGRTTLIPTGISVEIPKGYEGRVIGRSGMSIKGFLVHHGVIEEEYRGTIGVMLANLSGDSYRVNKGDRIAQFSIHPVHRIELVEVEKLSETERGANGYGSSGV